MDRRTIFTGLVAVMVLIIAQTSVSLEDATVSFDWDGSNLIVGMESPVGVGKAQVKVDIPAGLTVGDATTTGFMSGATHMSSDTEHRWFQLSANGNKTGSLIIPITCSGSGTYPVNLTEISIKDSDENDIIFDTEFPQIQNINCNSADTNSDGNVDDFELLSYIDLWVQKLVGDFDLLSAIDQWAKG